MFSGHVFNALHNLIYFALFCTGSFFIYQGQVVQRYLKQRTDFFEYNENITEFPSMVAHIRTYSSLKLGFDFDISFQTDDFAANLSYGVNSIGGNSPLKLTLEKLNSTNAFKITPHGYKEAEKLHSEGEFSVNYIFRKAFVTDKTVYGVAFHLVSENNSVWIGVGSKIPDGDSTAIKADLGSKNRVDITPEKYLFLHQKGICQVKYERRHKARH